MINVAVGINMEGNGNCAVFFPQKPSGYRAAKYTVKDNFPLILSLAVIDQSSLFLILIVTLTQMMQLTLHWILGSGQFFLSEDNYLWWKSGGRFNYQGLSLQVKSKGLTQITVP